MAARDRVEDNASGQEEAVLKTRWRT